MSRDPHSISPALVRLVPAVPAAARPRYYRPLVIGPAILCRRRAGREPWRVEVSTDGRLRPQAPRNLPSFRRLIDTGPRSAMACRVAAALIAPDDLALGFRKAGSGPQGTDAGRGRLRSEIYGWALMYQPTGLSGLAFVDRHDQFEDLPAWFELPLELVDRAAHLEARGFRTRPIAIITRPEDFEPPAAGGRNRFFPTTKFHAPCRLSRLL